MEAVLVPHRSCGSCNVCCVVPKIDEPALQKLPGCRCRNAMPDGACAIYEARPRTCREFFCGWRILPWIDERLRPNQSAVFIRLTQDETLVIGPHRFALMVTVLTREGLNAPGLIETIVKAIGTRIDTYLVVPGAPGFTSSRKRLNSALDQAVKRKDGIAAGDLLVRQYTELVAKLVETRPVVLTAHA